MSRSSVMVATLAVVSLALGGCAAHYSPRHLTEVSGDPASTALEVGYDVCGEPSEVWVDEAPDAITITVRSKRTPGEAHNECAEGTTVHLERPLGQRDVIDGSTGEAMRIQPLESGSVAG